MFYTQSSEELTDSGVGQYCAALYNDNSWNRAVITETKLVSEQYKMREGLVVGLQLFTQACCITLYEVLL